jgi:hypothetical protein
MIDIMTGLTPVVTPERLRPGTIVSSQTHWFFRHRGIVSDRWHQGNPMIISNSARAGGVAEESWDEFAAGHEVSIDESPSVLNPWEVVARARSRVGSKYRVLDWNCEHFVSFAQGFEPHSPQMALVVCLGAIVIFAAIANQ